VIIYDINEPDSWACKLNAKGNFVLKEVWEVMRSKFPIVDWYQTIWSRSNNPKMAHTLHKALLCKLPTKDRLNS